MADDSAAAEGAPDVAPPAGDDAPDEPNFLPPFANEENKKLNRAVHSLERQLEGAEAGLEENQDRISVMDEHLTNVQSELRYTEARVGSKTSEVKTEAHLKALCERESARIQADVRLLNSERNELLEKVSALQNSIYRANEKMDQFKVLMNWNQEELEQWALTQQQKEEDNGAIERYRQQDDSKIKELNIAIERMNAEVFGKRADLEREVTDTQAAQIQLDKAADDFSALHKERQELIRQWDDAMEQMRRNDAAIEHATEKFAAKKGALRELQSKLDVHAQFLDTEMVNNKERDAQIALLDRDIERLREVYAAEQKAMTELSDHVEIVKFTLSKAANDCATKHAENEAMKAQLDKKRVRLDDMRKRLAANRRKLESEYTQLDTLDSKQAELEVLRKAEMKRGVEVEKEVKELEKIHYLQAQALFKERAREKDLISTISGGQAQNRNMVSKIQQLDDQVVRQQELLYNVEFQLQQMERKVARAKGERSDEETRALNVKIDGLTKHLEGINVQHSMLLAQVKKAEDDLSHAIRANTNLNRDKAKIESDMAALTLNTEMIARSHKLAVADKQQRMVDLDLQKLEVQRLRQVLNTRADDVFSFENKKFQLQQSILERRHEIDIHRESLQAELKLVKDDVHRVTLELQDRRMKVSRLEAKFAVLSNKNKSVYEEDEPKSQAYYVIKAAQQREDLQREGDALDKSIRTTEVEVTALESTLQLMVGSNMGFSKSFKPVNEQAAFRERAALREKLDKAYDRLKFKRNEERAIARDIEQAGGRVAMMKDEQQRLQRALEELERRRSEAEGAVQDQDERLERAEAHFERLKASNAAHALPDIQVMLLREGNRSALHELKQLALSYPSAGIKEAMDAAGIRLPAGTLPRSSVSQGSSRNGSEHSTRSASAASLSRDIGSLQGSASRGLAVS